MLIAANGTNAANMAPIALSVSGAGFGGTDVSGGTRLGFTSGEASVWASDTALQCQNAGGVRGTKRMVITVAERSGTLTEVASYDQPTNAFLVRGNTASTGSVSVTV